MKPEQKVELVRYRLQQSEETLREAEILLREGSYRGSVNRSYYAMFYAILALAVKSQVSLSKHAGVIAFFDQGFVKTGIFSRELSRKLHLAFDRRQVHDYGELTLVDEEIARETLGDARLFVEAVENHLMLIGYV